MVSGIAITLLKGCGVRITPQIRRILIDGDVGVIDPTMIIEVQSIIQGTKNYSQGCLGDELKYFINTFA